MRLKKHLDKIYYAFKKVMDEQNSHRIGKKELVSLVNSKLESRCCINQRQFSKIIFRQKMFDIELRRYEYVIKKKNE